MSIIYHLVPADHWHRHDPTAVYLPRDFTSDGFVHCTRGLDVLLGVANTLYRDVPGEFLLLAIDEGRVSAQTRDENGFPHIYGPVDRDAIVAVHNMLRHENGHFELPTGIDDPSVNEPSRR